MKTFKAIRAAFWEAHPEFRKFYKKSYTQNQYNTDIRCAFGPFVDGLCRDNIITEKLAKRVTL